MVKLVGKMSPNNSVGQHLRDIRAEILFLMSNSIDQLTLIGRININHYLNISF